MNLQATYRQERAKGHQAKWALAGARTRLQWEAIGGLNGCSDYDGEDDDNRNERPVRLKMVADDDSSSALDFDGSEAEHKRQAERANREGVWGLVGEYWDGSEWVQADSVWGFIGEDWKDSGYDTDIMATTMDALAAHLSEQAEALEATRPDLYATH